MITNKYLLSNILSLDILAEVFFNCLLFINFNLTTPFYLISCLDYTAKIAHNYPHTFFVVILVGCFLTNSLPIVGISVMEFPLQQ